MRLAFSISSSRCRFRSLLACFQSQAPGRPVELRLLLPVACGNRVSCETDPLIEGRRPSAAPRGLCPPARPTVLLMLRTVFLMLLQARCTVSRHDTRRFIAAIRARARCILRCSSLSCRLSSSSRSLPTPPLRRSGEAGPLQPSRPTSHCPRPPAALGGALIPPGAREECKSMSARSHRIA